MILYFEFACCDAPFSLIAPVETSFVSAGLCTLRDVCCVCLLLPAQSHSYFSHGILFLSSNFYAEKLKLSDTHMNQMMENALADLKSKCRHFLLLPLLTAALHAWGLCVVELSMHS